jgi:hypothetical protein
MKKSFAVIAILALLAMGGQAFAEQCTIDAVPAATLLLPYFEVNFESPLADSINTFFTINNASAAPALAHVTLWTNLSIPTIDFDVYLTGYDVQVINLGEIFREGILPVTATSAQDTATDSISPHGGAFSDNPAWDDETLPAHTNQINTGSCSSFFPFTNPALNATLISRIQNGHTGQAISGNTCLGYDDGKSTTVNGVEVVLATGYITIDNVNSCSVVFPGGTGYFVDGGQGIANNRNQLWGDYFIVDPANAAAFGDNLVHIEAYDPVGGVPGEVDVPDQSVAFDYTFYNRYTIAFEDNREPLANAWATRYITGGAFSGGTRLAVWRDSGQDSGGAVTCGTTPFDLNPDSDPFLEEGYVAAFNESEDAVELCEGSGQVSPPQADVCCFCLETNWVQVGDAPLDPPFNNGWLYLNLDLADVGTGLDIFRSQAWVTPVFTALGLYEAGYAGIQLQSTCDGLAGRPSGTITQPGS